MRGQTLLAALAAAALLPVAAALGDATSTGQDAAHSGVAADGAPVAPLGKRWERTVGAGDPQAPLIADGRVFVVSSRASSSSGDGYTLHALDLATGSDLWSRSLGPIADGALAFDAGHVMVRAGDDLRAFAAPNGQEVWSARPPGEGGAFDSSPVAADGTVYALGTPPDELVAPVPGVLGRPARAGAYALRSSDGGFVWAAPAEGPRDLSENSDSRPAPGLDAGRVYVATGCGPGGAAAYDRASGAPAWSAPGGPPSPSSGEVECGGPAGAPQIAGGELFVPGGQSQVGGAAGGPFRVLDPASGDERGIVDSSYAPALTGSLAILGSSAGALAQERPGGLTRWTWPRAGTTESARGAPVVAGPVVYVPSQDLVALRLEDGAELWRSHLASGDGGDGARRDLAAGGGYLLATNGRALTAFARGPDAPGLSTKPPSRGELMADGVSRQEVLYGQRVRARGRFFNGSGGFGDGRAAVLEADPFPFDGMWREVGRTTGDANGAFGVSYRPERNTRLRFRDPATADGVSQSFTVLSDFGLIKRDRVRGRRVTTTVRLIHSPRQRLAGRRLHFYLGREGARPVRRASRVLRKARRGDARASATFRIPAPRAGDFVFVCVRENTDDGYGKRYAFDRTCGRRRL